MNEITKTNKWALWLLDHSCVCHVACAARRHDVRLVTDIRRLHHDHDRPTC
jgi:hypothetical protein